MKNVMKIAAFVIAAAMMSAGVCAEEIVEVVTESAQTMAPSEDVVLPETPVMPDEPVENDIAIDIAVEDPVWDEDYLPDEDGLAVTTAGGGGEVFPELGDIEQYLEENDWPDYLSFICNVAASINGYDPTSEEEYQPKMTYWWDVGTVNASPEQKAEIQALIDMLYPIENNLTFIDCTYSHAEREALVPEILETVKRIFPELQVKDVSLIRNTEQIAVTFDTAAFDEDSIEIEMVREKLYATYGDLVFVSEYAVTTDDSYDIGDVPTVGIGATIAQPENETDEAPAVEEEGVEVDSIEDGGYSYGDTNGAVITIPESASPAAPVDGDYDSAPTAGEIAAIAPPTEQSGDTTVMWICIVAGLVIALGTVAFIYRAKLIPVFASSGGDVTLNKKQTEEAVKDSEVIPDDSVLQAIKEKIEK